MSLPLPFLARAGCVVLCIVENMKRGRIPAGELNVIILLIFSLMCCISVRDWPIYGSWLVTHYEYQFIGVSYHISTLIRRFSRGFVVMQCTYFEFSDVDCYRKFNNVRLGVLSGRVQLRDNIHTCTPAFRRKNHSRRTRRFAQWSQLIWNTSVLAFCVSRPFSDLASSLGEDGNSILYQT